MRAHGVGRKVGLAAMVAALWAMPAVAQLDDIPTSLVREREILNATQRGQIQAFVAAHAPGLTSQEASVRNQARTSLRRPLMDNDVSVSFRIGYSAELTPKLREAVRSGNREAAIAALLLAGELATAEAAQLAAGELANADPILRYQAAYAIGLTLHTAAKRSPAMTPAQCESLITAVGQRVKFIPGVTGTADEADPVVAGNPPAPVALNPAQEETDPWVLDRLMRSLAAAMEGENPSFESVRSKATRVLCAKTIVRMRTEPATKLDAMTLEVLLRGAQTVERSFNTAVHDDKTQRLAIALGADSLAFVARHFFALPEDDERRQLLSRLSNAAENIVVWVRGLMENRRPESMGITAALTSGNERTFRERLEQLIGRDGLLMRAPYNLGPERFR